jgi:hypothetical protein
LRRGKHSYAQKFLRARKGIFQVIAIVYTMAPDRQGKRAVIPSREDGEEPGILESAP